jgi:hypothetical protein
MPCLMGSFSPPSIDFFMSIRFFGLGNLWVELGRVVRYDRKMTIKH